METAQTSITQAPTLTRGDTFVGWLCILPVLLSVLAAAPFAEMGVHDDWSYIYSAKIFAETGHIAYNGWAAFPLGWLLFAGALFIRVFGFSFTTVRSVDVIIGCLSVPLVHALFRRLGLSRRTSVAATLTLVLCPLFLALTASFMSDIPSLFCMLLCLYGCVRAMQARTDRAACAWLMTAAIGNLAGGTVRQIAWLGVLTMVPATAFFLRRRRGVFATGMAAFALSVLMIAAILHWFNHQPYVAIEPLLPTEFSRRGLWLIVKVGFRAACTMVLVLSPLLFALAMGYPIRDRRARRALLAILSVIALVIVLLSSRHGGVRWLTMLTGDYLSAKGILDLPWFYVPAPDVLPRWVQALFTAFAFSTAATCLLLWSREKRDWRHVRTAIRGPLFFLLGPFTAAYLLLVMTRAAVFDRYFLPVLFVLILLLLRWMERRRDQPISVAWVLPLVALTAYGVAGMHDLFALTRARLMAADELRSAGVPRTAFQAGFEYDAWTQLEKTGHVNEPRMRTPAGAYQPWTKPANVSDECVLWFSNYTPSIHPEYVLSNRPGTCYPVADMPPVHYRTWFAPREHTIYIERLK
ncbi:ArnT family glycosyltransferase [Terriglobus roseus]|uniref:Dolichyl-phosphate-mannose-protein mannosyltransferase n=1 Tax=Terriglobus roseus TaxID=392734 RepID=A0A1H4LWV8_9BACT|nr:glycosyltransferase family 39 protein [Terriglobus roseus]SEB75166.1 Dolichyl-phosphate-mannose-protein mannosyltransferase [Terriglobus roseus]